MRVTYWRLSALDGSMSCTPCGTPSSAQLRVFYTAGARFVDPARYRVEGARTGTKQRSGTQPRTQIIGTTVVSRLNDGRAPMRCMEKARRPRGGRAGERAKGEQNWILGRIRPGLEWRGPAISLTSLSILSSRTAPASLCRAPGQAEACTLLLSSNSARHPPGEIEDRGLSSAFVMGDTAELQRCVCVLCIVRRG
jgi:hypothetical protein